MWPHELAELQPGTDVFADDQRYAIRINDEFTVDVMPSIAGLSWKEMQSHVIVPDIDGIPLLVAQRDLDAATKREAT